MVSMRPSGHRPANGWKVATDMQPLLVELNLRCNRAEPHQAICGINSAASESYPPDMARAVHRAFARPWERSIPTAKYNTDNGGHAVTVDLPEFYSDNRPNVGRSGKDKSATGCDFGENAESANSFEFSSDIRPFHGWSGKGKSTTTCNIGPVNK